MLSYICWFYPVVSVHIHTREIPRQIHVRLYMYSRRYITYIQDSQRQNTYTEFCNGTKNISLHSLHESQSNTMQDKNEKGTNLAFCCCTSVYVESSLCCSPSFSQLLSMYVHRDVNVLTFMMSFILRYYSCIKTGLSWEKVQLTVSKTLTFLNYEKHCLLLNKRQ